MDKLQNIKIMPASQWDKTRTWEVGEWLKRGDFDYIVVTYHGTPKFEVHPPGVGERLEQGSKNDK